MSYLAEAITALMRDGDIKRNVEVAQKSGLAESAVSRWINGLQTTISDEDLTKLARALSNDPEDHAKLVAARMRDMCRGPGAQLVKVSIGGDLLKDESLPYGQTKLPPRAKRVFDVLADNYLADPDLRDVLDGLANMFERDVATGSSHPIEVGPPMSAQKPRGKRKPGDASASAKQT